MEAGYLAAGWTVTTGHSDADLFVVRGCSVTARAQYECERLIAHLKHKYPTVPIAVCGCLKKNSDALSAFSFQSPIPGNSQALPSRTARAYLKVQDGCSGKCTFCIVPKFRGASKSDGFTAILDRARRFIDSGYHEIVITGCNLALYASAGKRLPDLLSALAGLASDCRIRLGSLEPGSCAIETIHAMSEHSNICRFLHLPVQSGADTILKAMRRPYLVDDVEKTVKLAATLMPRIGLGCDLMTGFPGETALNFTATAGLLKRLPFTNAHIFPFSARPETLAAGFPLQIAREVKSARAHELSALIRPKRSKFARSFVGKTVEIVVEDEKPGRGWTSEYLPCKITKNVPARKSLARVLVTNVEDDILKGHLK